MDGLIPSIMSAGTSTTSLLLLMFLLVVTGKLVPRWRYDELKEDLREYEDLTKNIMGEFQLLVQRLEGESKSGPADNNAGESGE